MYNPLRKITTLAKELRKRNPNSKKKWTDYVKEAAKQIKSKEGRSGIKQKVYKLEDKVTKGIVKHYLGRKKKATKKAKKNARHFLRGTDAPRGTDATHKDVKSHNLKINFFSGVNELKEIKSKEEEINYWIDTLNAARKHVKDKKLKPFVRASIRKQIKNISDKIKILKYNVRKQKASLKRHL